MAGQRQSEGEYVRRTYRQIIVLALASHSTYVVIAWFLHLPILVAYNIASTLFYCVMQGVVARRHYRTTVCCIHVEVCIFAMVTTVAVGWDAGTALYLIALASLIYFCPFRHKFIPYLFSLMEVCVFLGLKLYTSVVRTGYLPIPEAAKMALYIYNACACFIIILYAAFTSKVSAAVSQQDLQEENRDLSVLANYDQLTGLLNRHAFLSKLEKLQRVPLTLVIGDIDDFKVINDTWGHTCGDLVLSEAAELIRRQLGGGADICRWGGEEFVFLFRGPEREEAVARVQALCDAVAAHAFRFEERELHVTMTFGVSSGMDGMSWKELVEQADRRMYRGKASGKNQVTSAEAEGDPAPEAR